MNWKGCFLILYKPNCKYAKMIEKKCFVDQLWPLAWKSRNKAIEKEKNVQKLLVIAVGQRIRSLPSGTGLCSFVSEWRMKRERKKNNLKASFPSIILDTTLYQVTLGGLSLMWTKKHSLSKNVKLQSYEARRNLKPRIAGKVTRIQKTFK